MDFMTLKDESQIEIQSGATLNSIVVLLNDYVSLEKLANSLSDYNLSEMKFLSDGKVRGSYEHMALKTPNFCTTKLENGKIKVVFGIREKTAEEMQKDDIQTAISYLSDEQASTVISLYPAWQEKVDYTVGERIKYDGKLYKCIQDHTSQSDWTPDVAVSLWAEILTGTGEEILEWKQPESTNPYMKGDKVLYNEKRWISDVDNNIWEPGVFGWTIIEEE